MPIRRELKADESYRLEAEYSLVPDGVPKRIVENTEFNDERRRESLAAAVAAAIRSQTRLP